MTKALPKVSIVIPVYNGADFLAEAIDSALAQVYANKEIIVVNDGSSDNGATERVAQSYSNKIRYFSKPNGGVASALNVAIEKMTGEYLSWLSHDDLYLPHKVERQMEFIRALGSRRTIVYSDFAVFSSTPDNATAVGLKHVEPEQFRYWITIENALHGCTLLIPREAFAECGRFDETLRTTQDYDLWFRMALHYRFVHLPEVLVKGRVHPGQGTVRMAGLALKEGNELLTKFVNELSDEELAGGARGSPVVGYAEITVSMRRRRFVQARKHSFRLTMRKLRGAATVDRVRALEILAKGSALDPIYTLGRRVARVALSPTRRAALRSKLAAPSASSSSSAVNAIQYLSLKEKFTKVYDKNIFGGAASRSGAGSDLLQTAIIRREIPRILNQYGIRSLLDAPCGDWHWMHEVDLGNTEYTGVDIVEQLIARNTEMFGRPGVTFQCLDLSKDGLPCRDLVFSRDCLVHLSFDDAKQILTNFKASGAKYLLKTTFPGRSANTDLGDGFWRPLNMELPPFNFPEPLEILNEGCTEADGKFADKSLGLWKLEDLLK